MRLWILLLLTGIISASAEEPVPDFVAARRGMIENQRWESAYDFTDCIKEAEVTNTMATHVISEQVDAVTRPGIFQHPNPAGQPIARMHFPKVTLPGITGDEKLVMHFYIAMSERIGDVNQVHADGCRFLVEVDRKNVFDKAYTQQDWFEWVVDLTQQAGKTISVTFLMDPLGNSNADWALWGEPDILIEGRKAEMKKGPAYSPLKVSQLDSLAEPKRVINKVEEGQATSIVAVMDENLDLAAQLEASSANVPSPVPLAPELVAGEGPAPENHTLIRVLNRYGIPRMQFLAFPPGIRGGVNVAVACKADGGHVIVSAPLLDTSTRDIHLFTTWGGFAGSFQPDGNIRPPFALVAGNFLADHMGDEIGIAARDGDPSSGLLVIYSLNGEKLKQISLPSELNGGLSLTVKPGNQADLVLAFSEATGKAFWVSLKTGEADRIESTESGRHTGAFTSVFDDSLWLTGDHPDNSVVCQVAVNGTTNEVSVGKREQLFWYQWADWREHAGQAPEDGQYVRLSRFEHLRTEFMASTTPDAAEWPGSGFKTRAQGLVDNYEKVLPCIWEPCFTHRQPGGAFAPWYDSQDTETGLPMYKMLTRNNNKVDYIEFESGFNTSTYGFGWPTLENYYILPLRGFLHLLAVPFRKNPEHFVAVEPNHEHEIAVEADGSKGDYNLKMVEGYYDYLHRRIGGGSADLAQDYGIPFNELGGYFDAPRNWKRGVWDDYVDANRFYTDWVAYNRYVVNRRLAQTYREALLAGFPPDSISSHQIPDVYALGSLQSFSTVLSRFSPIDYAVTAGIGFGFTRYGVWYRDKENIVQGAKDSGFGMYTIGEYQALTPSVEDAFGQLSYIHQNGGYSVHCMRWPDAHDQGFNASMMEALQRLLAQDTPRPGVTGGVGQIRPFRESGRAFNIVSLGTGPNRQGLLKSVNSDGSWEGTVYVTPFRTHVNVGEVALRTGAEGTVLSDGMSGLRPGEQLELVAEISGMKQDSQLHISVLNGDKPLPGLVAEVPVGTGQRTVRYTLRVQLETPEIRICVEPVASAVLAEVHLYRETQQAVAPHLGITSAEPHKGGVTFDILPGK